MKTLVFMRLLYCSCSLITGNILWAQQEAEQPWLDLTEYCVCRTDLSDTVSFNAVRYHPDKFRPFRSEEEFEPSKNPVWLKCSLPYNLLPGDHFFLTIGIFDEVTLYFQTKNGKILRERTGRMIRPDEWNYQGFPHAFVNNTSELDSTSSTFIQIKDFLPLGRPKIHPRLYDESTFLQLSNKVEAKLRKHHFVFGLLGGIFLAFFLFPIAYFVFNRQAYFLYYAIYILLSFIFVCFTFERFGHMNLLFAYAPKLMEHLETPLNSFSIIFYFLFLRSFLDAKTKAPLLHGWLGFLVVYQLTFQILDLFIFKLLLNNYEVAYKYAGLGTIPGLLCCLYLLFVVFRWKKAETTFIGIGMVFFLVGVVLSILEFEGKIPSEPYSLFDNHHILFQFGIVLELFFFSFALSYRNRSTVRARIEAQSRLRHLEELDQAKSRLFTNISHEFRTPLQVILGLTEQISKTPKLHLDKRLELIRKNGQNLLSMASQILDLARLETGYLQLQPVQSDVILYLKYLADSSRSAAVGKNISISCTSDMSELIMDYDPERLKQIVYNLLSNAAKFTPNGGKIQLSMSSKQSAITKTHLLITVRDNGIGMDEATQSRIFDRFYSSSPVEEDQRGAGIGLALVKELVTLMNGKISLKSQKGKGSTFEIEIPITRSAKLIEDARFITRNTESAPALSSRNTPKRETAFPNKKNRGELLLLVEDSEDVLYYLRSLLGESFQIVQAIDGEMGITKALQLIPDIILSDIMMPKVDGYQLCRTLKNDPRTSHIPIVLLTAKATKLDEISGLQHGADGYLYKPIDAEELFLRLGNLIELRRKIQEKYRQIKKMESFQLKGSDGEGAFLKKLHQIVLDHLEDEELDPDWICAEIGISRTQLYRKLSALTGLPLARYIRDVRLHTARDLLETTQLNIGEVAFKVGFKDPSYFTRIFSREFGLTPSDLRKK